MTRVAIVAGGARDTGLVGAIRLARCGLDVALVNEDLTEAGETVRRIAETGRRCVAIEADLADSDSFNAALARVRSELGSPGVLLNCVPLGGRTEGDRSLDEARFAATRRSLRTLFVCCRAVAEQMVRKRSGRIINVAQSVDESDHEWRNGQTVLAGLIGFTRSAAQELAAFGITVNFIAPIGCAVDGRPPAHQAAPSGHAASYSDGVAHLAEFLISEQAIPITGQGSYVGGRPSAPEFSDAGKTSAMPRTVGRP